MVASHLPETSYRGSLPSMNPRLLKANTIALCQVVTVAHPTNPSGPHPHRRCADSPTCDCRIQTCGNRRVPTEIWAISLDGLSQTRPRRLIDCERIDYRQVAINLPVAVSCGGIGVGGNSRLCREEAKSVYSAN